MTTKLDTVDVRVVSVRSVSGTLMDNRAWHLMIGTKSACGRLDSTKDNAYWQDWHIVTCKGCLRKLAKLIPKEKHDEAK